MKVAKEPSDRDSGRKSTALAIWGASLLTVLVAVVIAIVIAGSADETNHEVARGDQTVKLTAAEVRGRRLFGETCASCHALGAANAVGRIGPNLDEIKVDRALVLNAIEYGRSKGRGEMPGGLYNGTEAEEVAAFVAAATQG